MDDQTLIKAFLKKQKEIQDKFLMDFTNTKKSIDTAKLESLLNEQKATLERFKHLEPSIDTFKVSKSVTRALNDAIDNSNISSLSTNINKQTFAIEQNNRLLANGTGWRLNFWVLLLTLLFGFMAGWGVNWYFEIPKEIAGVSKYQTLQKWYDGINETMRNNCKLAKAYYTAMGVDWHDQCGTDKDGKPFYPLETSQELISGH